MSEGKGTNDMSLRANRKTRAPTLAKRISGPIQKATSGLPGGKSYGAAQPRPQAGGKVFQRYASRHYVLRVTNKHVDL